MSQHITITRPTTHLILCTVQINWQLSTRQYLISENHWD